MRIGYARVSTADQNLDVQVDALRKAGCHAIYEERASGSDTSKRPELTQALKALRPGDSLVVWRLDRLGRNVRQLLDLVHQLHAGEMQFVSLTEMIDTSTANGELVFNVFSALAQFERQLITERTRAGLAAAKARGRIGGRKRKLSPADIKEIRAYASTDEVPVTTLAKRFGVSRPTIYKYLDRSAIAGKGNV